MKDRLTVLLCSSTAVLQAIVVAAKEMSDCAERLVCQGNLATAAKPSLHSVTVKTQPIRTRISRCCDNEFKNNTSLMFESRKQSHSKISSALAITNRLRYNRDMQVLRFGCHDDEVRCLANSSCHSSFPFLIIASSVAVFLLVQSACQVGATIHIGYMIFNYLHSNSINTLRSIALRLLIVR